MSHKHNSFLMVALLAAISFFGVTAEAATGNVIFTVDTDSAVLAPGEEASVIVRALVKPGERIDRKRVPLAVALVIDKSGSMASDRKMENAKLGAIEALHVLGKEDIATVVVYDSGASVLVKARSTSSIGAFEKAISPLRPSGTTALYDGVQLAAKELRPYVKKGYAPRIILLSDGQANVGPSSARELARFGRQLSGEEMTITTIGLGLDYNEDLMTALAAESGGNSYFAKDAEMLPEIFVRDMDDAVTLTARRVRITLECDGVVSPVRILGRDGDVSGRKASAMIDNLYGSEKYALFEVKVPAQKNTGALSAGVVKLEYVDPDSGRTLVEKLPLKLTLSRNEKEIARGKNSSVLAQAEIAKNAEIREEVIRLADQGRTAEASQVLRERKIELQSIAPSVGAAAPVMEAEAVYFDSLADSIETSGTMSNEARKESMNKAYIQKTQQNESKDQD